MRQTIALGLTALALACGGTEADGDDDLSGMPRIEVINPAFDKSGGNLRGKRVAIPTVIAQAQQFQDVLRLRSGSDDEPVLFGIQVGLDIPGEISDGSSAASLQPYFGSPPGPLVSVQLVGVVEWGWEGSSQRAYFDWVKGTSLGVVGSYVRVAVAALPLTANGIPVGIFASATCAIGRPQNGTKPTLTLGSVNPPNASIAAAGGSFRTLVPPFASTVKVSRVPQGTGPILLTLGSGTQTFLAETAALGVDFPEIAIPNGTDGVLLTNNDAANPLTAATFVYGLNL